MWIYLTIEAWKYWKWKALLPYPTFLLIHMMFLLSMKRTGVEYPFWTNLIVAASLNLGGLIIFSISLIKEYTKVSKRTETLQTPSNLTTIKQEKAGLVESVNRSALAESCSEKFLIDSDTKKCPFCAEIIKMEAIKCRFCGESLDNKPATTDPNGHIKSHTINQTPIISSLTIDKSDSPSAMNATQRIILLLTAAFLIIMLLFPPFYLPRGVAKVSKGYRFILNPIKMQYWDKDAEMEAAFSFEKEIMADKRWNSLPADIQKGMKNIHFDERKKQYPKMLESDPPLVDSIQLLAQCIIVIFAGGILCFAFKEWK
jgi:hypothetical protein